jgi:2-polyprenyl-6-methoxyphenol hydroxylase-like FAD-dependent oxidoreductase
MKVGIIGGGPVGTSTAILLKQTCGEIDVHVFEQRAKFTRNQILLIDKDTWKLFPESLRNVLEKNGCYVRPPPVDSTGRCYRRQSQDQQLLFSIRISVMEQMLWDFAKKLGVHMHRPTSDKDKHEMSVSDPRLKEFDILIGAGGKTDILRQYLNIPLHERQVSTAVILTWNPAKNISFQQSRSGGSGSGRKKRRSFQHRYRMFRSQNTNYYATIQLTPNETKQLKKMQGRKAPLDKFSDIVDPEILTAFDNIFRYYDLRPGEFPKDGKISLVPITLYYAPDSVGVARLPTSKSETLIFLVGDAVNGVHFFSGTGVNTGIKMASVVANAICKIQLGIWTINKAVDVVKKHIGEYIDQARIKSTNVILNSDALGQCKTKTIKELRNLAKRRNYIGIGDLSKIDMCLIMGTEFVE